jgi:hypothetical protein
MVLINITAFVYFEPVHLYYYIITSFSLSYGKQ